MMSQLLPGEFLPQFLRVIGKGRQDVLTPPDGHYEERPIIPQPWCERCHWAGREHGILGVISSKRSYVLKWCKLNNHDDDIYYLPALVHQLSGCIKHLCHSTWNHTKVITVLSLTRSFHCIRLTRSRLTVCKYAHVVAIECTLYIVQAYTNTCWKMVAISNGASLS